MDQSDTPAAVCLLRRGPRWDPQKALKDQYLRDQHVAYMIRLLKEGVALHAGPFYDPEDRIEDEIMGLIAFRCDAARARDLMDADPGIVAGTFAADIRTWYA